ncbi:hypothetical protein [Myroides odoratus]|uniref:Uncharacterized protein n=1 Tax=Myroides odoratus TaxID=256 RepID=A0A378U1Y4_MYROD|nr:hypothetical protein [Myroides odoratus]QQU03584.1 hypothetical protein I6I89_17590 [Myroides odoratus]STZ69147.1 Uncharacterised protein [Myroides odoratus]
MYFNFGDVVVFKTHPYTSRNQNIKIGGYADYTSPLMVVNKRTENKYFDSITREKIGEILECVYYNSKTGKYESKRISSLDLVKCEDKVFAEERKKLLHDIDINFEINKKKTLESQDKEITVKEIETHIKSNYFNVKVVLKSVDIELHKEKINREKDNGELIVTNHLDFLPPVMTVIGYRFYDEKNKFCQIEGKPLLEFKCKWFNSQLKTYSEEYLKVDTLYKIDLGLEVGENSDKRNLLEDYSSYIDSNYYHQIKLKEPFELEEIGLDVGKTEIRNTLVQIEDITFKHYFYMALVDDLLKNKKDSILVSQINKIPDNELWGTRFPDYLNRRSTSIFSFEFKAGEYYYISYADKFNRFSKRVIKVREVSLFVSDKNKLIEDIGLNRKPMNNNEKKLKDILSSEYNMFSIKLNLDNNMVGISIDSEQIKVTTSNTILHHSSVSILLETNCLLRKGKIRHFRLDGIYEIQSIKNGSDWFEEEILYVSE